MAEGLEFLLELDAKLEGALGMVRALQQADGALKQVDASLHKVEQSTKKHGDAAKHTGGILDNFLHAVLHPLHTKLGQIAEFEFIRRGVDALIEAPGEALHLFTELFEEMIKVSAQAERTDMSFKLLFGEKEGKETLEWIEKIAKYTEFTQKQLKGGAQDLAKVGFKGEGLTRAMDAAIDIAAFDKSGEAGMAGAISSLERIKRSGRVEGRTLGGLGLTENDFYSEMAKRTGKGRKELKKEMAAGNLDVDKSIATLNTLIARRTGKDLGGAGVAMGNTLQARLTHLQELPELFFEKLKGTKGYGQISDFVGRLLTIFDPEGEVGAAIQASLNKIFNGVGNKLESIDIEGIFRGVPAAIDTVTETIKALWSAFEPFVKGIELVAKVLDKINLRDPIKEAATQAHNRAAEPALWAEKDALEAKQKAMKAAMAAGTPWVDPSKPFGPQEPYADKAKHLGAAPAAMAEAPGIVSTIGSTLSDVMHDFTPVGYVNDLFGIGQNVTAGVAKGITAGAPAVSAAGWNMVDDLATVTATKAEAHSPSRLFERLGRSIGDGFNDGIEKSTRATDDIVAGAFAVPAPSGGQRGGNTISVEIHTTVHASGDGEHIAQEVSQQIREIIPGALQSAFEQLANQAGSA